MMIRTVIRELKDYPATALFCLSWIVVFVAMAYLRLHLPPVPNAWQFLVLGMGDGHRFGDLTVQDLERAEYWRLLTCTFVHYSVIHIILNLLAFYLLGTLLESWYGSAHLILIYLLTGGLGNVVSVLIRRVIGANPLVHSGGGSVVIMGLIGLCVMVGWRSRTERGSDLGWQMFKALLLTGLLGLLFPRYIDNWGHAGGVIVGFPVGLAHRALIRNRYSPSAWGLGTVSVLVILVCFVAQLASDRREGRRRVEEAMRQHLREENQAYQVLRVFGALCQREENGPVLSRLLASLSPLLEQGGTLAPYRRLRELSQQASARPLSDAEKDELKSICGDLAAYLRKDINVRLRQFWEIRREGRDGPARSS